VSRLHLVLIRFSDLNKMCVGQSGFCELRSSKSVSQLHKVLIRFSDLNEVCVGQSGFHGLHFAQCVHSQLLFGKGGVGKVCCPGMGVCNVVCSNKTSGELECAPRWRMSEYQDSGNTGHRN
jgi:hypothetical protein